MSEGVGQREVEDWRRLRACPGCDYSLEALPAEGVCPECGRGYDQRFVVLTGLGRGQWEGAAGGTWRGMVWLGVAFIPLLWLLSSNRRGLWSPPFLVVGMMVGGMLLVQLYVRLFSAREPRMQLWMAPEGVGQVPSTPEGRRARTIVEGLSLFFAPVFYVAMFLEDGVAVRGPTIAFLAILTAFSVAAWRRRRKAAGKVEGSDFTPRLWPWGEVARIQVNELQAGRVRVRCMVTRRWGRIAVRNEWPIDIEIACPAKDAESLGRQMVAWCPKAKAERA